MNAIAEQLNEVIQDGNSFVYEMLSDKGKNLFFPKGILSQSAEAKQKAYRLNATIGIATQEKGIMCFPSVMDAIDGIPPEESLTYAPSFGIAELRKEWKKAQLDKNPSLGSIETSLPVVSSGITHALSLIAEVWIDPGDNMVLPDMMWGNYNLIFKVRNGANINSYSLFTEDGKFNIPAFEACVKESAKKNGKVIVLLNFPQNPTGYTVTEDEGCAIARVLTEVADSGVNVVVVADDAYFGLFYEDDIMKESIFCKVAGKHERIMAIKLDGATKENFAWGLRVGFMTYGCVPGKEPRAFYDALERKTAGCLRGNVSNASHLGQSIVLRSMRDSENPAESQEKFDILKARAVRVKEVLADPKYKDAWDVYPFNSGYFMCVCLKNVDAEKLRVHLLDNYGVGLIAIGEKNLRIAFSCLEKDEIQELFDILLSGVNDLT